MKGPCVIFDWPTPPCCLSQANMKPAAVDPLALFLHDCCTVRHPQLMGLRVSVLFRAFTAGSHALSKRQFKNFLRSIESSDNDFYKTWKARWRKIKEKPRLSLRINHAQRSHISAPGFAKLFARTQFEMNVGQPWSYSANPGVRRPMQHDTPK